MKSCASVARDAGARRQPEVAHAVGQPEVDHLGHRALVRRDRRRVLLEHARGRLAVDVGAPREGLPQVHVARDVGQDAQLDLAVVGGQQHVVRVARPRRRAGCVRPELGADGDVLEVRVGRREPAGRRDGLLEGRVQAARSTGRGAAAARRRRSSLQLRVERASRAACATIGWAGAELLEDRRVGRVAGLGAPAARQVQLVEEDLLELLGAAQVELVADRRRRCPPRAARSPSPNVPRQLGQRRRGRWRRRSPPCPRGPG